MHRHNTCNSNTSSSASGSENNSDIGAEHTRFGSSKKISITTLTSKFSDVPSTVPVMSASEPPPEINHPALFRPSSGHVTEVAWQYCTIRGWLTKHIPPSYSFTKSRKVRYVLLVDRILYTFKTDQQTSQYREFFELTKDTDVFVTDHFQGVLYCIEIVKRGIETKCWFLECSDADDMKVWLERLKRTVGWLKENDGKDGVITNSKLDQMYLNEHEAIVANALARTPASVQVPPVPQINRSTPLSSSDESFPGWKSCYSSSTEIQSPKTPPLLHDPSYYQNIMMVASENHYQQQHHHHQQHHYQPYPHHEDPLLSSPSLPTQPPDNLYYTSAYVEEWEPSQRKKQQQQPQQHYNPLARRTLSAPHVLPPQHPPPRRALPPLPVSAAVMHYQQYHQQRTSPRSAYSQ